MLDFQSKFRNKNHQRTQRNMNYTIRKIRKEDDAVIENIIRTCLIEFGAAREGTAWRESGSGQVFGDLQYRRQSVLGGGG